MKLQRLLETTAVLQQIGSLERQISAVEVDSRACRSAALFVAVETTHNDGHVFIDAAIDAGAQTIVCQTLPATLKPDITYLRVADSRQVLAELSLRFHGQPQQQLRFIGITGTNGKTSCTYIVRSILKAAGARVAVIGTTGNIILDAHENSGFTTPEQPALAQLLARIVKAGVQWVVMEVSSHALAQERVAGITFEGALFTNITRDHLDFHGGMRDYINAKRLLFSGLPAEGAAAINADDLHAAEFISAVGQTEVLTYGRSHAADVRILQEQPRPDGTQFSLQLSQKGVELNLPIDIQLPGAFNVMNASGAAALCLQLGIEAAAVREGLATAPAAPGRMQQFALPNGAQAIVDYAHTPDALANVLSACRAALPPQANLICVFGCGGDRDAGKRPQMGRAAAESADQIILTNDNPRSEAPENIVKDIQAGIPDTFAGSLEVCVDRGSAIRRAMASAQAGDTVLIAGKGHETYQLIGSERLDFSDAQVVSGFIKTSSAN